MRLLGFLIKSYGLALVCGLSSARPVMRGPVVGFLFKESSSPSQTLRIHFTSHSVFSQTVFREVVIGNLIKPVSKGRLGEDLEILRSVLIHVLHRFRINEERDPWIPKVCNLQFFSIKLIFVFFHGDLGC